MQILISLLERSECPYKHKNIYEYHDTIKYAYLYGKIVTLSNKYNNYNISKNVSMQNRRMDISMSGIQQFCAAYGINELTIFMFHISFFIRNIRLVNYDG